MVTFIDTIQHATVENVSLLDRFVAVLFKMQNSSAEMTRLYQICSKLASLASAFVHSEPLELRECDELDNTGLPSEYMSRESLADMDFLDNLLGADFDSTQIRFGTMGQD